MLKAKEWMKNSVAINHSKNTLKLRDVKQFVINPFILTYLAYYFKGNADYDTLAKVLLYPRILGTSIATTFGTQMQKFISQVLGGYGSLIPGIDIEFEDKIDGRKKYYQIKAGPQAINKDDIETISNHFQKVKNLSRTNNFSLDISDMVLCLVYGEPNEKSSIIKVLEKDHTVYIGKEFWHHLTGDENFYAALVKAIGEVAVDINMKSKIDKVVKELAQSIQSKYEDTFDKV